MQRYLGDLLSQQMYRCQKNTKIVARLPRLVNPISGASVNGPSHILDLTSGLTRRRSVPRCRQDAVEVSRRRATARINAVMAQKPACYLPQLRVNNLMPRSEDTVSKRLIPLLNWRSSSIARRPVSSSTFDARSRRPRSAAPVRRQRLARRTGAETRARRQLPTGSFHCPGARPIGNSRSQYHSWAAVPWQREIGDVVSKSLRCTSILFEGRRRHSRTTIQRAFDKLLFLFRRRIGGLQPTPEDTGSWGSRSGSYQSCKC